MTKTVVHVTTLEEWKSVLDVWFKQGYEWLSDCGKDFKKIRFNLGSRQLGLNVRGYDEIIYWSLNDYKGDNLIEYAEFMAQQKEENNMETYYVTKEQYDLIEELKCYTYPLNFLFFESKRYQYINTGLTSHGEKALLRYLGGDTSIEFKVKEQLYRLWRIDNDIVKVYMKFGVAGTPTYSSNEYNAFTAPLEEIKKWKTPAWDIEDVDYEDE